MNTIKKTVISRLMPDAAEVETKQYLVIEGREIRDDTPKHATTFVNSIAGRERVRQELPAEDAAAILAKWGDKPTVATELPEGLNIGNS